MDKTRAKIIQATLAEIERAGLRATTKQIAQRAGVNELTLFRHFDTKQQLIVVAIRQSLELFLDESTELTGTLETDLQALAKQYVRLADDHPGVITAIFSETDRVIIKTLIAPLQQRIANKLLAIMRFYQQQGLLMKLSETDLVREFMGPLLARAFLAHALERGAFDEMRYVQRFLKGHAPHGRQPGNSLKGI